MTTVWVIRRDRCLQHIAHLLSQAVGRPMDLVARYGDEEFAIVLPETDLALALRIAQGL
ncbi:MAG: GGDEF domain-containing protein [Kaiparowitsia implicata GSE-PSE-MK54-09C]|jgi:diguanylate cyclase (GGDEF)-like protein|nr:GGDEF domain-containing protein [Kaiparowitsia implicata GSE-PSE-MK54-09C]